MTFLLPNKELLGNQWPVPGDKNAFAVVTLSDGVFQAVNPAFVLRILSRLDFGLLLFHNRIEEAVTWANLLPLNDTDLEGSVRWMVVEVGLTPTTFHILSYELTG